MFGQYYTENAWEYGCQSREYELHPYVHAGQPGNQTKKATIYTLKAGGYVLKADCYAEQADDYAKQADDHAKQADRFADQAERFAVWQMKM